LICCRKTRFSASSFALDLNSEARTPKIRLSRSVIRPRAYPVRSLRLRRIEFSVHTTRQSGQWGGKSFIGGGRKSVRSALFLAAMVASRHNPVLKRFRNKLVAAGKPKPVALIAVAREVLTILNTILRDKRPWQPEIA
jgi:hypothetical protein